MPTASMEEKRRRKGVRTLFWVWTLFWVFIFRRVKYMGGPYILWNSDPTATVIVKSGAAILEKLLSHEIRTYRMIAV